MLPRRLQKIVVLLAGLVGTLVGGAAHAEPLAMVGILQGSAVLVRQTTRYALAEGAALSEGDIVETPAGAFVQLEFDDGALVGLGESTRLILKPRLTGAKPAGSPRLYLLEGWLKITPSPSAKAEFDFLSPPFELDSSEGAVVTRLQPQAYALFIESGSARLIQRGGGVATLGLKGADFVAQPAGADRPTVSARLAPDFVQQMPRFFRDRLPARAPLFAKRVVTLKALGPISYADVSPWLHTESAVRLALSKQWRSRASDRAFRAEVATNLSAHMEWERVIFPERFLPKKPPEPRPFFPLGPASGPITPPPLN